MAPTSLSFGWTGFNFGSADAEGRLDVDFADVVGIPLVGDREWAANVVPRYLAKSGVAHPRSGAVLVACPSVLEKSA
jgi:hypothetical protein